MERLSALEAAARVNPDDRLGLPLGPGQPPTFMAALGERDDWTDLQVYGALLSVGTELFNRSGVSYLSGFFGPFERALRDADAAISFAPADFRRFAPLYEEKQPRVMCTVASPPDADGYCSLSLHAGGSIGEIMRVAKDPDRLLIVEAASGFPGRMACRRNTRTGSTSTRSTSWSKAMPNPWSCRKPEPTDVDVAIAEHAAEFIGDGSTIQTGIGAVPSTLAALLAKGEASDLGVHSEMFTTGLMRLHESGRVTNRKGSFDGTSIATFALGTSELYEWLDGNDDVAFLPVEVVNSPERIAANRKMISINAAMAVDVHGQVVADTINARQYSGIGGAEDFAAGPGLELEDRSLLCLPSTVEIDGRLHSRIVPWFERGAVITVPRHQADVIITEHGAAELAGKTTHQRGLELARIAHPDFRDELVEAAKRASKGNPPFA